MSSWNFGGRHRVVLLGFFGFFNVYAMRVNLSVASIKMSDEYGWCGANSTGTGKSCSETGTILGSFFYGYLCSQILGGYIATRFGGKHVFGVGVLATALLTLATPWAAGVGIEALIAVRILEGLFEGVTFPAFHAVLGRWVPIKERTKYSTFAYAGAQFGTVLSNPLSGYLCSLDGKNGHRNFMGGWPSVFYVCGALGCIWYLTWMVLFTSDPEDDKWVSKEELAYIQGGRNATESMTVKNGSIQSEERKALISKEIPGEVVEEPRAPVPWYSLLTSMPLWAIICGNTVANWGFYNLLTCLPQYMKNVLDLDISKLGFISSLPYLSQFVAAIIAGRIADYARAQGVRTVTVRKVCQCGGGLISAAAIVGVGYYEGAHTHTVAIILLCISLVGTGIGLSGFLVNHLDIAPQYAGVLMGITNTVGTIPGFVAPLVTDIITTADPKEEPDLLRKQWQEVFLITAGVYVFGAIFYGIFAAGDKQSWADGRVNRAM